MGPSPSQRAIKNHPLLADRARLDAILDVMSIQIQRVLYRHRPVIDRSRAAISYVEERVLVSGESFKDVLQEAVLALLNYPAADLTSSWEALAVRIAQNSAKGALRRSTKGRRTADLPQGMDDRITLVSLDAEHVGRHVDDGDLEQHELEREFRESRQQQILYRLARELFGPRELRIFIDVHHLGINRADVGRALGLTGQRVGQIYRTVAERLLAAAHEDAEFRRLCEYTLEGASDD